MRMLFFASLLIFPYACADDESVEQQEDQSIEALVPVRDKENIIDFSKALKACTADDKRIIKQTLQCQANLEAEIEKNINCDPDEAVCKQQLADFNPEFNPEICETELLSKACTDSFKSNQKQSLMLQGVNLGLCKEANLQAGLAWAAYYENTSFYISTLNSSLTVYKNYNDPVFDGDGMIVQGDGVCYGVFRGSSSRGDLDVDLSANKTTDCSDLNGKILGKCGLGFYNQYSALRDLGFTEDLVKLTQNGACPNGVRLSGHSLGGALASILATDLYSAYPDLFTPQKLQVYTFGEPRNLETSFAQRMQGAITKYRFINYGDPITALPYTNVFGVTKWGSGVSHWGNGIEISRNFFYGWVFKDLAQNASATFPVSFGNHRVINYRGRALACYEVIAPISG